MENNEITMEIKKLNQKVTNWIEGVEKWLEETDPEGGQNATERKDPES